MCRINPRVDFACKKIVGSKENKDLGAKMRQEAGL